MHIKAHLFVSKTTLDLNLIGYNISRMYVHVYVYICDFLLVFIRREKSFPLRCSRYVHLAIKLETVSSFDF
jgi:hypothetical protein